MFWLWAMFLLCWLLHLLLQAQVSVKSDSNCLSGLSGLWKWLSVSIVVILTRLAFSVIGFSFWLKSPGTFGNALPVTWATAGGFGFAADSLVDKVATLLGLKVEIPKLFPPTENQ